MEYGSSEIKKVFAKLNKFLENIRELNEEIKDQWQREFSKDYVSSTLSDLLKEISFFQLKYNIPNKLRIKTEEIYDNIEKKFKTKKKDVIIKKLPGFVENLIDKIPALDLPVSESREYKATRTYGSFTSDPKEDFDRLFNETLLIYQYYFSRYSFTELDVLDINIGQFFKLKLFKNWKTVLITFLLFLAYNIGIIMLSAWLSIYL